MLAFINGIMEGIMRKIRKVIEHALDMLFPVACFRCGKAGIYVCEECIARIPLGTDMRSKNIYSVFSYKDPTMKRLLWSLKYRGNRHAARLCGRVMYDAFLEEFRDQALFHDFKNPRVVPIPLSAKRKRERGFNQAELIARECAARDDSWELTADVLYKIKDTLSQTACPSKIARMRNVSGSFAIRNAEKVKNKNIILIDDIYTTGATFAEAKRVLRSAGARVILCLTVAH